MKPYRKCQMADSTPREELVHTFARFGPAWVRFLRAGLGNGGMSAARVRLLSALRKHPAPPIMREVCDDLGTTPRAVTALVDGLEAEGLVRRVPHASDRRATVLVLTDEGERVTDALWHDHIRQASSLFDELSETDQRELLRILGLLIDGLHRRGQRTSPGGAATGTGGAATGGRR